MGSNGYEQKARQEKAGRLAALFFDAARDACFRYDTVSGSDKPRAADDCADDILTMAGNAPAIFWVDLARKHKINVPSSTTISLATHLVVERCQRTLERKKVKR